MADRNFERALRSAARRGRTVGVCPDSATLASYVDRSLSSEEHAAVEAHVADCIACTEHLALIAALDVPEDSPVPAFDIAALVRRWGWLVPATTAVLVVGLWMRSSDQRPAVASLPAPTPAAEESRRAPESESDRLTSLVGANDEQSKRDVASTRERQKAELSRRAPSMSTMADAAKPAAPSAPGEPSLKESKPLADSDAADKKEAEVAQADQFAANAPASAAAASPAAAPPPPPQPAATDTREGALAKAAPEKMLGRAIGGAGMRKVARQEESVTVGMALVRTTAGRIDRSTDGGQSWTTEHSGLSDQITVTVCPTDAACWLGANNGAVFVRTADGQWIRRVVPAPATRVQRIVALDNQHATVELADGRRYVTSNGGLTWSPPPPQP